MRCFGPSAAQRAVRRREELEKAFGEGYDEAEEARIFALEELARQQSALEEAFGEGYDPEEEARIFAEHDVRPAVPPSRENRRRGASTRFDPHESDASEDEYGTPPATATATATASQWKKKVDGWSIDQSRTPTRTPTPSPPSEPSKPQETDRKETFREPPSPERSPRTTSPTGTKVVSTGTRVKERAPASKAALQNAKGVAREQKPPPPRRKPPASSLPALDFGDAEKYRKLRETLGVDEALGKSLAELLAPLEALPVSGNGSRLQIQANRFGPLETPSGLFLPFARREAYGRLKLREREQEHGRVARRETPLAAETMTGVSFSSPSKTKTKSSVEEKRSRGDSGPR
jgi:hypothetical protein